MTAGRRRPLKKPKGKEGFCWAWKKDHRARGVAAEKRKDWEAAEKHRCHRQPQGETRRCYLHGGTAKSGKAHHSYKHGFPSGSLNVLDPLCRSRLNVSSGPWSHVLHNG